MHTAVNFWKLSRANR